MLGIFPRVYALFLLPCLLLPCLLWAAPEAPPRENINERLEGWVSDDGLWVFRDGIWTPRERNDSGRASLSEAAVAQRSTRMDGTLSEDGTLVVINGRWVSRQDEAVKRWEEGSYWTVTDGQWIIVPKSADMTEEVRSALEEVEEQEEVSRGTLTEGPPPGLLRSLQQYQTGAPASEARKAVPAIRIEPGTLSPAPERAKEPGRRP